MPASDSHCDAVVIGGGPGGSTVATLLARAGCRVVLLERERFPRFKIGESMLPMVREIYARLGVEAEIERTFIRKYGAHFVKADGSREYTYEFRNAMDCPFEYAYHVKRDEHDRILLENARRAGAEVRERWHVEDVLFEDGERAVGVRARPLDDPGGEAAEIRAPFVVDASGRASLIAKKLRLRKPDPLLRKAAAFSHYRGVRRLPGKHEGTITIATFPGGWIWVIPFRGDVTSVGAVMHREFWRAHLGETAPAAGPGGAAVESAAAAAALEAAIAACPAVAARLSGAERVMPVLAEGAFSYRSERFAGPGWVLCGDAAAFLDPIFSSGVLLSMRCGEEIAAAIEGALARGGAAARAPDVFARYERRMRAGMKVFWRFIYGFYDAAFLELFLQPTNRFRLMSAITGVLAGNIFPSLKFRLRMWALAGIVRVAHAVYRLRGIPMPDRVGA